MPYTSPEKIVIPAPDDAYALTTGLRTMAASARTIVPVANVADRAAVVAALVAAATPPTPGRPLYTHRADAALGSELEVTVNGTTWRTIPSGGGLIGSTGVVVGTVPPAGTFPLIQTVTGVYAVGADGKFLVTYPVAFPNGLLSAQPALLNGNSLGAWLNFWGAPTLTNATLAIWSGMTVVPNVNVTITLLLVGW